MKVKREICLSCPHARSIGPHVTAQEYEKSKLLNNGKSIWSWWYCDMRDRLYADRLHDGHAMPDIVYMRCDNPKYVMEKILSLATEVEHE